jgi:NCS2 family nucleobase:cation symporter-2
MAKSESTEQSLDEALFKRKGVPPIGSLVPMSLQHVVASFAGVITPAMMIASTCGFTPEQETAIIQVALILSAIDTLLQQFPLFGQFGAGLPILTGVSFAFLPAFQAVGGEFGFSTLLGAELVGGVIAILFGLFYSKVRKLFPPLVTGTVIFTIGVSLYPTAIRYMAGGAGTPNFGGVSNWIVGLITFAVVFAFANFGKGVVKLGSIFFGIIIGCIVALPFGMVDASDVLSASWFSLPQFMPYPITFNPAACITLGVVYIMVNVQLIGDLSAATAGSMDRMPNEREIGGAIKAQGLVSIISAFFGGLPTSAFGQNVGIIVSTKVINRWVFGGAAFVFLAAGLCPKLSALLLMIPQPCNRRRNHQRIWNHYTQRHPNPGKRRPYAACLHRVWHLGRLRHRHRAGVGLACRPRHARLDLDYLRHVGHHPVRGYGNHPEQRAAAREQESSRREGTQARGGRSGRFQARRGVGPLGASMASR